jgi:hypothetical protein
MQRMAKGEWGGYLGAGFSRARQQGGGDVWPHTDAAFSKAAKVGCVASA